MPSSFEIRFLISNLAISLLVLVILLVKRVFKRHLSLRVQYNIWFLFLFMLALPILPVRSEGFLNLSRLFSYLADLGGSVKDNAIQNNVTTAANQSGMVNWLRDFSVSVDRAAPSILTILLLVLWLGGAAVMLILTLRSSLKIKLLISSALPVQSPQVKGIIADCCSLLNIEKEIPVLSCAYLQSPVSVGLIHPRILLPIQIISEFDEKEIRFILLHELQHYRYKDIFVNYLMCLAKILYWFHPLVWLGLKEMRNDRELACDASVLSLLGEEDCTDYGYTLLRFAGKLSGTAYPLSAGLAGTRKQITKRIMSIASYRPENRWLKIKSGTVFAGMGIIILSFSPLLSVNASQDNVYDFPAPSASSQVDYEDLSTYYKQYDGSFVLYDQNADHWTIYNKADSTKRISPDSTFKIYSAFFGLESGSITPEASLLPWDGSTYPYTSWNRDQTIYSAMKDSVNWYFQSLDQKTGMKDLKKYVRRIGYGNADLSGGLSRSWMESSLKISPVEQVELLTKLYTNEFRFQDKNIQTVKDSLLLSDNEIGALYGKTGTGNLEHNNVNGWFVGFIEKKDNTYFFAANIQAKEQADGTTARRIALDILKAKELYSIE